MFDSLTKLFKKEKKDINLLPDSQGKRLTPGTILFIIFLILTTVGLTGSAFALKEIKNQEQSGLESKISQLETGEWKKVKPVANLLTSTKNKLSNYQKFTSEYQQMDKRLLTLTQTVPSNIKFTNLSIDNMGKAKISATAKDAQDINIWVKTINEKGGDFANTRVNSVAKSADNYTFSVNLDIK